MLEMDTTVHTPGFVLRVPPELKKRLEEVAHQNHRSMHAEVVHLISRHVNRNQKKSVSS
jgi:predicted transcriptional regulator